MSLLLLSLCFGVEGQTCNGLKLAYMVGWHIPWVCNMQMMRDTEGAFACIFKWLAVYVA